MGNGIGVIRALHPLARHNDPSRNFTVTATSIGNAAVGQQIEHGPVHGGNLLHALTTVDSSIQLAEGIRKVMQAGGHDGQSLGG